MSVSFDAIVLAAGLGTRMRSALPKVLHRVLDTPMVDYPIEAALSLGAERVVVVVGHGAEDVSRYLESRFDARVCTALQAEQKGTADAVRAALPMLVGRSLPRLILNGDLPLLEASDLEGFVTQSVGACCAFVSFVAENPKGYGRVVREGGRAMRVVEEKDATEEEKKIQEVNAGIYWVDAEFVERELSQIRANNAQRELYLPDLISIASAREEVVVTCVAARVAMGVNDRVELSVAEAVARARRNERVQRSGVTLQDPARTFISRETELGQDCVLGADVSLFGKNKIGRGVRIGQGSVLRDAVISDGCEIRPYCVMERVQIGAEAVLGPFTHLRPGVVAAERVHLGNFVEAKNTIFGVGTKANHLSYLGDAEIGSGVNVGAGTITCNYDGFSKHKTVIEDGVFIGSDVQLVAPVRVGKGAIVAAGACVVEEVPSDAIAVSRAKQENREGAAARFREKRKKKS